MVEKPSRPKTKSFLMGFGAPPPVVPESDPHSGPRFPGMGVLTLNVLWTPLRSEKAHEFLLTMMFLNA